MGHVACVGNKRNSYRIVVGKPQREKPLGQPRCRWEDDIKMSLKDIGWEDVDCVEQGQVAGICKHSNNDGDDNNNNNIYLLQLGCHLVAVVILHVYKT